MSKCLPEMDYQLEGGLDPRSRLRALEDAACIDPSLTIGPGDIGAVADQAAGISEVPDRIHGFPYKILRSQWR
jgi:hypothetical protein